MKKIFIVAMLGFSLLGLSSCDLDDGENFEFVSMAITEAEVPEFFELFETYEITVHFDRANNCSFFQGFDVYKDKEGLASATVVAVGSMLTENDCSPVEETITGKLKFRVVTPKEHTLRFYTGKDSEGNPTYLEHTIPFKE